MPDKHWVTFPVHSLFLTESCGLPFNTLQTCKIDI
jgi:hypothetical protein